MHGLNYEDDSKGNALAAMMFPGRIEFRQHRTFSDKRVRQIAEALIRHPDMHFARGFRVTYRFLGSVGEALQGMLKAAVVGSLLGGTCVFLYQVVCFGFLSSETGKRLGYTVVALIVALIILGYLVSIGAFFCLAVGM